MPDTARNDDALALLDDLLKRAQAHGADAADAVMIYGDRTWYGVEGARAFFTMWLDDLLPAGSAFDLIDKVATEDMVFISWHAESPRYRFDFGTDTFVMRDDRIWRQTVATSHVRK